MVSDLDIYRAANLLIERHGTEAELVASHRANEMRARGDTDGQLVWRQIKRAIEALQTAPSGPVH